MSPARPNPPLDAILQGYADPSQSFHDLAEAHRLSLRGLVDILKSGDFLSLLTDLECAAERRLAHLHATAAISALADLTSPGHSPVGRRRAAVAILRFISRPTPKSLTSPAPRTPSPSDRPHTSPPIARGAETPARSGAPTPVPADQTAPVTRAPGPAPFVPSQAATPISASRHHPTRPPPLPASPALSAPPRETPSFSKAARRSVGLLTSAAGTTSSGWP